MWHDQKYNFSLSGRVRQILEEYLEMNNIFFPRRLLDFSKDFQVQWEQIQRVISSFKEEFVYNM